MKELNHISPSLQYATIENYTEPQGIERGRTLSRISSVAKYGGAAANFRGRKSNSLMNLCGGKKINQVFDRFWYLKLLP